jgi:outer membrane protein OmpA-like peptidoglycan-associated protein
MKKSIFMFFYIALVVVFAVPAIAIELAPDAANVPSSYAKVMGGKAVYDKQITAYSPYTFNKILESYGLTLGQDVSGLPAGYTKDNKTSTAYEPAVYHAIFTAYGLQISPEAVSEKLGSTDYAKVVNDKVVFGKGSTAYSGVTLAAILSTYSLPVAEIVAVVETVPAGCIDSDGDTICDEIDVCDSTPKGVKVDERGCWTLEQSYLFDFDKAEVKPAFLPLLDSIAQTMSDNPKITVQVEGHTDSVGSVEYNQGLSERRANAIKDSLVKRNGVDSGRLNAVGFGESNPIMTNDTKEGRAKNRRVDLKPVW